MIKDYEPVTNDNIADLTQILERDYLSLTKGTTTGDAIEAAMLYRDALREVLPYIENLKYGMSTDRAFEECPQESVDEVVNVINKISKMVGAV